MKTIKLVMSLMVALCLPVIWGRLAYATGTPDIVLTQAKITSSNGQFFVLYNTTASPIDLAAVQLEYFNSYSLSAATSSKLISPTGTIAGHGYAIISDDSLLACYQLTIDSLSLGLSTTAGLVQLFELAQTTPGGPVSQSLQDYVAWAKTSPPSGVQKLPSDSSHFLARRPLDGNNNPSITTVAGGSWVEVSFGSDPCTIEETVLTTTSNTTSGSLLPSSPPPATIVSLTSGAGSSGMAASDIGLRTPQITELLPNPASPTTDAEGEFIEIYNSNLASFDLSNFVLQTGLTTNHKYSFPSGTLLKPRSFTAYLLKGTGLGLSNSSGQAALLDPSGKTISQTDQYGSAKDGQSWALANDRWYWTTTPTPSSANVVNQPNGSGQAGAGNSPQILGASTLNQGAGGGGSSAASSSGQASPIHSWTLAGVGGLALGYALYEYRQDLANRLDQLRRYRAARVAAGAKSAGRRSAGAKGRPRWRQDDVRARVGGWYEKLRRRF